MAHSVHERSTNDGHCEQYRTSTKPGHEDVIARQLQDLPIRILNDLPGTGQDRQESQADCFGKVAQTPARDLAAGEPFDASADATSEQPAGVVSDDTDLISDPAAGITDSRDREKGKR